MYGICEPQCAEQTHNSKVKGTKCEIYKKLKVTLDLFV